MRQEKVKVCGCSKMFRGKYRLDAKGKARPTGHKRKGETWKGEITGYGKIFPVKYRLDTKGKVRQAGHKGKVRQAGHKGKGETGKGVIYWLW